MNQRPDGQRLVHARHLRLLRGEAGDAFDIGSQMGAGQVQERLLALLSPEEPGAGRDGEPAAVLIIEQAVGGLLQGIPGRQAQQNAVVSRDARARRHRCTGSC